MRLQSLVWLPPRVRALVWFAPLATSLLGAQVDARAAAAREGLRGVEAHHGWLRTDAGYRVRTILTKPSGVRRRLPAILFVQWLSCDRVELSTQGGGGWAQMLRGMIERSSMVFARTEKPGLAGSEGPPCAALDYETELAVHRAALRSLRTSPDVDPDSIFVFGASMGGTIAPLLARDASVRGVIVWGTTGRSWLEHLTALDRRVLELRGTPPADVTDRMGDHVRLLQLYLTEGRAPPDILRERPALRRAWEEMLGTGADHQYGRPFQFHQQAERADWQDAWGRLTVPVLVVRGEYDWLMSSPEHEHIVRLVNQAAPGAATLVTLSRTDHHFDVYQDLQSAFDGTGGQPSTAVVDVIVRWLDHQRGARQ